ncbi:MAG: hypothetical protein QXV83_02645 [Candidatus Anstonellaceae archaeon]
MLRINRNNNSEQKKLRKEIMGFYKLKENINKELLEQKFGNRVFFRKTLLLEERGEELYKKLRESKLNFEDETEEKKQKKIISKIQKLLSATFYLSLFTTVLATLLNKTYLALGSFVVTNLSFFGLNTTIKYKQKIKQQTEILNKTVKEILDYYKLD